jgi:hypothetical protein
MSTQNHLPSDQSADLEVVLRFESDVLRSFLEEMLASEMHSLGKENFTNLKSARTSYTTKGSVLQAEVITYFIGILTASLPALLNLLLEWMRRDKDISITIKLPNGFEATFSKDSSPEDIQAWIDVISDASQKNSHRSTSKSAKGK